MSNKIKFWRSKKFWQINSINSILIFGLFLAFIFLSNRILDSYASKHYQDMMELSTEQLTNQMTHIIQDIDEIVAYVEEKELLFRQDGQELKTVVSDITSFSSVIDGVIVRDQYGTILASNSDNNLIKHDDKTTPAIKKAEEGTFSFQQFTTDNGDRILQFTTFIQNQQAEERAISFYIDVNKNEVFTTFFSSFEISERSFFAIYDQTELLFVNNQSVPMDKEEMAQIESMLLNNGINKAETWLLNNEQSYLISHSHIPNLNWNMVMMIPQSDMFALSKQLNQIFIPVFISLAIMLFLIVTMMMHQQLRPLNQLFEAIKQISEGNYQFRIKDIEPKSDIGSVNAKFNVMVNELAKYRQDVKRKNQQLEQQKDFLNRIINYNPSAIYTMNWSGEYTLVNKQFSALYGLTPSDVLGKNEMDFNPNREEAIAYLKLNRKIMKKNQVYEVEDSLIDADGKERWFHVGKVPILGSEGKNQLLCVATEITDLKAKEATIKHQAYYDDLTNIPNRSMYKKKMESILKSDQLNDQRFALLFLDLDRFKYVNDTFGHDAGDALLRNVATRLQTAIRDSDTVFRFGGDEFTILATEITERQDVANLAKRILTTISEPYLFNQHKFITTASIGISLYPDHATEIASLTKYADIAMYQSKQQGKNTFRFYTAEMETALSAKLRLEMDLYEAMNRDELFLHYQPIVQTKTGKLSGVECLLRWEHHQLGLISPSEFIPIAEETGLIHELGEWVLKKSCHQLKIWQTEEFDNLHLSVNLSPVQLNDAEIIEKIKNILLETGIEPSHLQLEITETAIMQNQSQAIAVIVQLQKLGVLIAIDDFGKGYSSLNVLKKLPVDTLKIDRSFIDQLLFDHEDDVVLQAMFDLAKKMRLSVIAEGIETEEQLTYIKQQYCQYVQGFFFSQPLPADRLTAYLRDY